MLSSFILSKQQTDNKAQVIIPGGVPTWGRKRKRSLSLSMILVHLKNLCTVKKKPSKVLHSSKITKLLDLRTSKYVIKVCVCTPRTNYATELF